MLRVVPLLPFEFRGIIAEGRLSRKEPESALSKQIATWRLTGDLDPWASETITLGN